ncbi:type I methionyl aminopeptidase [Algiphilus sp. NNCM1]|uniref:type I methionyl aminopeptidase n=1 Tax=Algiphilus sp. TaxID=1872431 RepID=UPI001CA65D33|nr:type I methionyl aminopeptidase [Algiphilus sp.]MBY8965071.1 type I methionyl aminopeptidase [Algiphilus acroporae]MCI5063456.1 type I methionyl aminopeptidase [Algiphilus sp.]MCI5104224.1 type I methionyl aminopeptidase [Algiphilus sp.]
MAITIKSAAEQDGMRAACQAAASVLQYLEPHVTAGITTGELDDLAREYVQGPLGCTSATIGYTAGSSRPPFPGAICTSVNHVVCHGIPGPKKLKRGDIMNIDVTVIKDGWHGDTSKMYYVGEPSVLARRLCETAHQAMVAGIEMVRPGATLGDIGHAVQQVAEAEGFSVVREYCGHGIGRGFHEDPQVLHYGKPGTGQALRPGMTFTIEPMVNAGAPGTRELPDGWTVVTRDHKLSAQWEHTILVTENGYEVLTLRDGAV